MLSRLYGAVLLVLVPFFAGAQTAPSPFSQGGYGLPGFQGTNVDLAAGNTGTGKLKSLDLNLKNPALLPQNQITSLAVGGSFWSSSVSGDQFSYGANGGGLDLIALGVPVVPAKWTSALQLASYSHLEYSLQSEVPVVGSASDTANVVVQGNGGLTSFGWSNGLALTPQLFVGMNLSYIFGQIENDTEASVAGVTNSLRSNLIERISYSGFQLGLSAGYRKFWGETAQRDEETASSYAVRKAQLPFLMLGATVKLPGTLTGERFSRYDQGNNRIDTLVSEQVGKQELPLEYSVGASYSLPLKYTISADFDAAAWSNYTSFDGEPNLLQDSWALGLGFDFTPGYDQVSYFQRITYLAGLNVAQLPQRWAGGSITQVKGSLGASLPVSRMNRFAPANYFTFSFQLGLRATQEGNLSESFFGFSLGMSFNESPWYKNKRRFN